MDVDSHTIAPVTCTFCGASVCGCERCQAYCECEGYFEYYIRPYEQENKQLGY